MKLNDLFVSYAQVKPISFKRDTIPQVFYPNLSRARKITLDEETDENDTWEVGTIDSDNTNWVVGTSSTYPNSDYFTRLKEFIIGEEGFRNTAYKDGQYYSIGYGFNGPQYKAGDVMTKEEADIELARQLETRENKYRKRFGDKWDNLTDNQKIALISYGYNTGDNNIVNGNVAKYLDEGNLARVKDSLTINTFKGSYNKGLDARRKRERELFDS